MDEIFQKASVQKTISYNDTCVGHHILLQMFSCIRQRSAVVLQCGWRLCLWFFCDWQYQVRLQKWSHTMGHIVMFSLLSQFWALTSGENIANDKRATKNRKRMRQEVFIICLAYLGIHVAPKEKIPQEVGCVVYARCDACRQNPKRKIELLRRLKNIF